MSVVSRIIRVASHRYATAKTASQKQACRDIMFSAVKLARVGEANSFAPGTYSPASQLQRPDQGQPPSPSASSAGRLHRVVPQNNRPQLTFQQHMGTMPRQIPVIPPNVMQSQLSPRSQIAVQSLARQSAARAVQRQQQNYRTPQPGVWDTIKQFPSLMFGQPTDYGRADLSGVNAGLGVSGNDRVIEGIGKQSVDGLKTYVSNAAKTDEQMRALYNQIAATAAARSAGDGQGAAISGPYDLTNLSDDEITRMQRFMRTEYPQYGQPTLAPPLPTTPGSPTSIMAPSAPPVTISPPEVGRPPSPLTTGRGPVAPEVGRPPSPSTTKVPPQQPAGEAGAASTDAPVESSPSPTQKAPAKDAKPKWSQKEYNQVRARYEAMTAERKSMLMSRLRKIQGKLKQLGPSTEGGLAGDVFDGTSPYLK